MTDSNPGRPPLNPLGTPGIPGMPPLLPGQFAMVSPSQGLPNIPGLIPGAPAGMMAPPNAPFLGYPGPGFIPPPGQMMMSGRPMMAMNYVPISQGKNVGEDAALKNVQDLIPGTPLTMVFVGGIAEGIQDDVIEALLNLCGPIDKWKRVQDPSGKPKAFGFCEYELADGVQRALRLLPGLIVNNKPLTLKVDDSTESYLKRYDQELEKYKATNPSFSDPTEMDASVMERIIVLLNKHNIDVQFGKKTEPKKSSHEVHVSENLESFKKSFVSSKSKQEDFKESEVLKKYQREEQKILQEEKTRLENAYKERLRKWESREAYHSKDLQKTEATEDDKRRIQKKKQELKKHLASFDDDNISDELFYTNREKWRVERKKYLEEEKERDESDRRKELDALNLAALPQATEMTANETNTTVQAQENEPILDVISNTQGSIHTKVEDDKGFSDHTELNKIIDDSIGQGERSSLKIPVQLTFPTTKRPSIKAPESSSSLPCNYFSEESNENKNDSSKSIRKRQLLVPIEYSKEELLASGVSADKIGEAMLEMKRKRLEYLAKQIPIEQEDVFGYDIEWNVLDVNFFSIKLKPWLAKKLAEIHQESLLDFIIDKTYEHTTPKAISRSIVSETFPTEAADLLIVKLWRYLILESENKLLASND